MAFPSIHLNSHRDGQSVMGVHLCYEKKGRLVVIFMYGGGDGEPARV